MDKQQCKVFVGGLSWETNDSKLRTYFENFGVVKEAFVSYDRETGKPRGFGFVVFEDAAVAERVVNNHHTIDRREVDAKHAMPRHENMVPKPAAMAGTQELPSSMRKIFVGGLPASVVDSTLREHFERYGAVEDAVVMIDHQSKRPRGFGFVTFADERSLDNVLRYDHRQSLHGKEVEVKRAVPRDQLSPRLQMRGPPAAAPRAPYDMRSTQYPPRYALPQPLLPYGYGLDPHQQQMERHYQAYYSPRLPEPELPASAMLQGGHMLRGDPGDAVPSGMHVPGGLHMPGNMHWPPAGAPGVAAALREAGDEGAEQGWQLRGPHAHGGPDAPAGLQGVGAMPMMGLHGELDEAAGLAGSPQAKSQPVPFSLPPKGTAQASSSYGNGAAYPTSGSGADAFENLASSLGASLPLGSGYLNQTR